MHYRIQKPLPCVNVIRTNEYFFDTITERITIYGPRQSGKTVIAKAIAEHLQAKGRCVRFFDTVEQFNNAKKVDYHGMTVDAVIVCVDNV